MDFLSTWLVFILGWFLIIKNKTHFTDVSILFECNKGLVMWKANHLYNFVFESRAHWSRSNPVLYIFTYIYIIYWDLGRNQVNFIYHSVRTLLVARRDVRGPALVRRKKLPWWKAFLVGPRSPSERIALDTFQAATSQPTASYFSSTWTQRPAPGDWTHVAAVEKAHRCWRSKSDSEAGVRWLSSNGYGSINK